MALHSHTWSGRATRGSRGVRSCRAVTVATVLCAGVLSAACRGSERPDEAPSTREEGSLGVTRPRIVSLVPSLTEIVVALGASDQLVARTDFDTHAELVALPSIGPGLDPSLEALVGLDVDIVLMTVAREGRALGDRLDAIGIEMITLPTDEIEDVYAAIDRLARLVGMESRGTALEAEIRSGLGEVEAAVGGRPRVDVLYVVWADPPLTSGGGTFVDALIRAAGGRNVFEDAPLPWPTVGFESIVDRDPDVVIWPDGDLETGTLPYVQGLPGWRDVPAVREGRVVFVDATTFNRPGPGLVASARELARALHPESFRPPA
jgi:iron complex transport system substrate-binding protein